jgi:predicted nuclease with TOPRIM domain
MSNYSAQIIELRIKTEKVLEKLNALKAEKESLKRENARLESKLQEEIKTNDDLNNKLKMLKLAKSIGAEESTDGANKEKTTELKRKLNEYIKEVDKCIALLNE